MEKKVYEAPEVTKVEIDFSDRIVAAGCGLIAFQMPPVVACDIPGGANNS